MANATECKSCGYIMNGRQVKCPYCGSGNPGFEAVDRLQQQNVTPAQAFFNQARESFTSTPKKKMSMGLFIVLLICFWPAALIYAVVTH